MLMRRRFPTWSFRKTCFAGSLGLATLLSGITVSRSMKADDVPPPPPEAASARPVRVAEELERRLVPRLEDEDKLASRAEI